MKIKKVSSILLVIALVLTCSVGTCFAGTLPANSSNTVPVFLTVDGELSIDFTISEKITMTGSANSEDLVVSNLLITNNGPMGQIEVKKLELTAESEWSVMDSEADYPNMKADSKKFALVCDGHDFSDGAKVYQEDNFLVDVSKTGTIDFSGKTCPTTSSLSDERVANVVVTVGIN